MTTEQAMDRSILAGKDRGELVAIAEAFSIKPKARAKKADLIEEIMQAASVGAPSTNGHSSNGDSAPSTREDAGATGVSQRAGVPEHAGVPAQTGSPAPAGGSTGPGRSHEGAVGGAGDGSASTAPPTEGSASTAPTTEGSETEGSEKAAGTPAVEEGGAGNGSRPSRARSDQVGSGDLATYPGRQAYNDSNGRRSRRRRGRSGGGERETGAPAGTQEPVYQGEPVEVKGLLDLRDEGYGFLRAAGYLQSSRDVYVSISQVRRFALRKGDYIEGQSRPAANNEKFPALVQIDSVCGLDPAMARERPRFEDLTPLFPDSRLDLEVPGDPANVTARIVDLLSPIGKGQRGMIVSPPKAGKTTVMKQIAHSIEANNPEVHLMVLLVDERPEEVTDMRRSVKGEVVASTFDRPSEEHTTVAELAIERAKRLVELGKDVVIILDGITRLARAYNLAQPATGRIMSGGVDSGALYPPKKFFGAARNIEEGGSLTILATALIETGSKMDEVIFEEFKGTGNMELRLDRKLAERRIYPAIDVNGSSTRHEELLFSRHELQQVWKLRRVLNALGSEGNAAAGLELLMDKIRSTGSNAEFLSEIAKGPTPPS